MKFKIIFHLASCTQKEEKQVQRPKTNANHIQLFWLPSFPISSTTASTSRLPSQEEHSPFGSPIFIEHQFHSFNLNLNWIDFRHKSDFNDPSLIIFSFFVNSFPIPVANRPELITKDFLSMLFIVWHHEKLSNFTASLRQSKTPNQDDEEEVAEQSNRLKVNNFIFCNVISSRIILIMQDKDRLSFDVYGQFLAELIREKFITVEDINELSIGLYKHEWSKVCIWFLLIFLCVLFLSLKNPLKF